MAVLNSTVVLLSIPHCLLSLMLYRCILLWHCTYERDVTTLISHNTASKTDARFENSGLGYDGVSLGEWFPTFRRYIGNHWSNDTPSSSADLNTRNRRCETRTSQSMPAVLKTDWEVLWRPECQQCHNKMYWKKTIRQTYNVQLPTVLLLTEFNTTITVVLLTNCMDIVSAGVCYKCGYKTWDC
jgi:hypothetical protein